MLVVTDHQRSLKALLFNCVCIHLLSVLIVMSYGREGGREGGREEGSERDGERDIERERQRERET